MIADGSRARGALHLAAAARLGLQGELAQSLEELPPPVNVDDGFASYHSKTEIAGRALRYTRTFEIKELSVPVSKVGQLKDFYRIIAGDERNSAVLKRVSP